MIIVVMLCPLLQALNFFNPVRRKDRRRGIICFFLGVFLVLVKWPVIGMIVEVVGIVEMFGVYVDLTLFSLCITIHCPIIILWLHRFLPYVIGFLRQVLDAFECL